MTLLQFLRASRDFLGKLVEVEESSRPPVKVGFTTFITLTEQEVIVSLRNAPNIQLGGFLAFTLTGNVPPGQTYSEPSFKLGAATLATGTLTVQPALTAPTDGSAPVTPVPASYVGPFTVAGVFVSDGVTGGAVDIEGDVLGVDEADAAFTVIAPETIDFSAASFVVGAPGQPLPSTLASASRSVSASAAATATPAPTASGSPVTGAPSPSTGAAG